MVQAALGSGHGPPAVGLRAVPPAAAGGAPLRRGGRRRPDAGRPGAVHVRRRGAGRARGRRRRRDSRVAGVVPLRRRHLGLRRGRGVLPLLAAARRRGHLRGGGGARDAAAVDLQPRLRDRVGGVADDDGRGRPAVHRDGLAAHPRGGGGRVRARGVHRRLRGVLQPRGPPPVRRADARAPAPTASRCCTTPRPTRSAPRSPRWARARPCWSTPTTCRRQSAPASRSPGRGWARCASTPATSACSPTRCASSSTSSARRRPGSW